MWCSINLSLAATLSLSLTPSFMSPYGHGENQVGERRTAAIRFCNGPTVSFSHPAKMIAMTGKCSQSKGNQLFFQQDLKCSEVMNAWHCAKLHSCSLRKPLLPLQISVIHPIPATMIGRRPREAFSAFAPITSARLNFAPPLISDFTHGCRIRGANRACTGARGNNYHYPLPLSISFFNVNPPSSSIEFSCVVASLSRPSPSRMRRDRRRSRDGGSDPCSNR